MTSYEFFRSEGYGAGDKFGNKHWVYVPAGTDDNAIDRLAQELADEEAGQPVELGGHEFEQSELTLFFYVGYRPDSDADRWAADRVVTIDMTARETAVSDGGDYLIKGKPSVIDEAVFDLVKLDSMENDEKVRWFMSMTSEQQSQLAHVCGVYVGLTLMLAGRGVNAMSEINKLVRRLGPKPRKPKRRR